MGTMEIFVSETVIGQVIAENDEIGGQGNVPALVNRATRDNDSTHLSQGDREEISRLLQEYNIDYEAQPESDEEELKDFGFYDKYARLLSIGTRVKRGPGWSWGNQDSNGPGTVVAHKDEGELMVKWDNGHINAYFYNHSETSHVVKYDSRRILGPGEDIEVGCCVKRGQDWNPNSEEDGGSGTVGIVIRKHHDKKVSVRWPSQVVEKYSFGHDNKYEIEVVNGHDEAQLDTGYIGGSQPMDIPGGEDIVYAWQWQDQSHQWRTLPQEAAAKLEDHYLSKKQGTTLVKHYSLQMRSDPVKLKYTINGQLGSLQRISNLGLAIVIKSYSEGHNSHGLAIVIKCYSEGHYSHGLAFVIKCYSEGHNSHGLAIVIKCYSKGHNSHGFAIVMKCYSEGHNSLGLAIVIESYSEGHYSLGLAIVIEWYSEGHYCH
ncbi:hypothetical protein KUTeg_018384 [Tegillarca granosa]|uniref:MIB/HERC2 domain-containing protein n=1 Tax=Tegillarca granosa TaxID=220873 RepID=A0ABQ9EK87_TEGGR|nr:hypothetical protein KUTeg_018384 [Tegillarca granosa]